MATASTTTTTTNRFPTRNPNPNPNPKLPHLLSFKFSRYPSLLSHLHLRRRFSSISAASTGDQTIVPFDSEKPREECGVVGIVGHPDAAHLCSLALHALQHRGQEGAGIAASDLSTLRSSTGLGLVSEVFDPSKPGLSLSSLTGPAAIGHVRYSTAGAAASIHNVQPFLASYRFGQLAVAHNGNLVNYPSLRSSLEEKGSIFNTSSDTEAILHLIATSKSRPFLSRVAEACSYLRGAYSLLFLTADKLLAVRDPHGFRPLVLGRLPRANGAPSAVVFASETCALDLIGAKYEREVEPGEAIIVDARTLDISTSCLMPSKPRKACVFELIYFALPQSLVFSHPVYESRYSFGATLAAESPVPGADVVIPVPDSGFFAALGFSERSGVPFQQGLIRSHYVGRTFIQPSQAIRDLGVKLKLSPIKGILAGKSVVVVDDSIVRGTTSSKIVRLIRDAGAKEVHMRIASPPIIASCYYGVDTPSSEELISNRMDIEGVRKEIGADSLAFLSLESLRGLLGDEAPSFCEACFSGNYPVPPVEYEDVNSKEPLYVA
ncbi:amidophosphoribosyltransferase, chloroplastic-like [Dioscorea cayenensis subsp. rotundata]|uniref:Amidophosphoribosyltransferase n=1 Tax=Dioscorea cayennensis subsp. rotundata TaxID=55577 RepID=A0AB40B618_DIOCR|nr:amidophosphoribosyltransferase, chloroplastic-like [Dioscorea cayenensis subsp. rotundata]